MLLLRILLIESLCVEYIILSLLRTSPLVLRLRGRLASGEDVAVIPRLTPLPDPPPLVPSIPLARLAGQPMAPSPPRDMDTLDVQFIAGGAFVTARDVSPLTRRLTEGAFEGVPTA